MYKGSSSSALLIGLASLLAILSDLILRLSLIKAAKSLLRRISTFNNCSIIGIYYAIIVPVISHSCCAPANVCCVMCIDIRVKECDAVYIHESLWYVQCQFFCLA